MLILALDTTTRAGSAAVLRDTTVLHEIAGDPALTHGQRLPADLMRLLAAAEVRLDDVELLAVAAGPGSFTGLRVGIATIQGLAIAGGRMVVPVSTLEALTRSASGEHRRIGAWMDAQRGEVFGALYGPGGRDLTIPPMSASPAALLHAWQAADKLAGTVFVGDGAVRYRDAIVAALGASTPIVAPPLLAGIIGRIAAEEPQRAVVPHGVVPIYVRPSDAELARARRHEGQRLEMPQPAAYEIGRLQGEEELDAVAALEAESFTNPWTRDMLARELRQSDTARVYVLRTQAQRVTAFCSCWVILDELHINTIAVDGARRREGLATVLLRHVFADAVSEGARKATLEVRRSNVPALRLYERMGFAVEAVRSRYYSQPEEDALVLWHRDLGEKSNKPLRTDSSS
jgi:tRNA threonylcarbamoyladenosine biosynthesis protein TsaB